MKDQTSVPRVDHQAEIIPLNTFSLISSGYHRGGSDRDLASDYYQCGHETLKSELQNVILHLGFPTKLNSRFQPKICIGDSILGQYFSKFVRNSSEILEFEFFMVEANVM